MKPCTELSALIAERASGPIARVDEATVAGHLAVCGACRAEAARLEALFGLARLPGASELEEREAAALPRRLAAAARRSHPAAGRRRWALGVAAVAVAVAAIAVPVGLFRRPAARPPELAEATTLVASADDVETDALADAAWELSADSEADVVDMQ